MKLTLADLLRRALARSATRTALRVGDASWTYSDLDSMSDSLASGLSRLGIAQGDFVALYLKNSAEYVVADLAILKIGAIKVPLNEYQSASEAAYILQDTSAATLVAHQSLVAGLATVFAKHVSLPRIICVPEEACETPRLPHHWWDEVLENEPFAAADTSPEDIALITYTGGTTGRPKGVVQRQASLAVNLWAHVTAGEIGASEVMLLATPLPHSAGYHLQAGLLQGSEIVLHGKFDPATFCSVIEQCKVTWTFLVPTMIYRLLDHLELAAQDHSSLRTVVYGAAPMSGAQLKRAIEKFGHCFIQLYGQTECPNYITVLGKDDHRNPNLHESCGKAVPFVDLATSASDRKGLGEVIVRSPYMLSEYFDNPESTRLALKDGWLHTGDIGYINEEGYLFLKDRAKDMIISGGMNVYTSEVEQVIKRHPAVADAAVVGLPHEDWGEMVHAVVETRNHDEVSEDALIDYCKGRLSTYKVPKTIEFRAALPLTAYGKVDKKVLRSNPGNAMHRAGSLA